MPLRTHRGVSSCSLVSDAWTPGTVCWLSLTIVAPPSTAFIPVHDHHHPAGTRRHHTHATSKRPVRPARTLPPSPAHAVKIQQSSTSAARKIASHAVKYAENSLNAVITNAINHVIDQANATLVHKYATNPKRSVDTLVPQHATPPPNVPKQTPAKRSSPNRAHVGTCNHARHAVPR